MFVSSVPLLVATSYRNNRDAYMYNANGYRRGTLSNAVDDTSQKPRASLSNVVDVDEDKSQKTKRRLPQTFRFFIMKSTKIDENL